MVIKSHLPISEKPKVIDDDEVSSRASLSSTSVDTLENNDEISNEELSKQPLQQTEISSAEKPPSYEHATSTPSSRYAASRGPPSVAASSDVDVNLSASPPQYTNTEYMTPDVSTSSANATSPVRDKKVKIHEGNISLHSSETITGPVIINGKLTIHGSVRFIGALEVRKSITNHSSLTCDGSLRVGKDISNHGTIHVSEPADIHGKSSNHGKILFAKGATHHDDLSNYGTITYTGAANFCSVKIKNHGMINAEYGVTNVGKVNNHGKIHGFSSL